MARIRQHRPTAIPREASAAETNLRDVVPKPSIPRVKGTRSVTAMLPNGGVAWLRIEPKPASAAEINRLRRAIQRADVHRAAGLSDDAAALRRLSKRVTADLERLGKRRQQRARKLGSRLLDGDEKNTLRFATELERVRVASRKQWAVDGANVQRQQRRHLWDSIVLASSAPLFAAYGQEGSPWGEHNLALGLSLGVWLLGDELSDLLAGPRGASESVMVRDVDFWSYVAPLGNLLTGWWLFEGSQNERFVTGIADQLTVVEVRPQQAMAALPAEVVDLVAWRRRYTYQAQLDLGPLLAPNHVDDFRAYAEPAAVASILTSAWDAAIEERGYRIVALDAEVEVGFLTITVAIEGLGAFLDFDALPKPKVAWLVDTRDPKQR